MLPPEPLTTPGRRSVDLLDAAAIIVKVLLTVNDLAASSFESELA
jgi:hypothetical protein